MDIHFEIDEYADWIGRCFFVIARNGVFIFSLDLNDWIYRSMTMGM
jgi:hypothetical protein